MNIAQIRSQYPQYSDLSDKQLADGLHAKFYSDLPINDYYKRIGFAPETTFFGQVKEGFKGLVPGAVGLVEQAAVGASALLPEEYEKPTREAIAKVAGAAKAPFAAAPGYEETVGRKLGEAVGSTVPFLAAGPLGLAGRAAAVGLGVGAGAGEARTRAEKEGATEEQRATATGLGIIPGAMEVFAPFRILSRIPEGEVLAATQRVKRVLQAAGEEAAQEAASGLAQNMIARGVYKPEQELIEGLGEQATYGGATGAIIQGLMDLAIGRRARGTPTGAEAEPLIERRAREAAEAEAAEAPAEPTPPVVEAPAAPEAAAPEVPEPVVRKPVKPGGLPETLPQVLDDATVRAIGFVPGKGKKKTFYDKLVGKDLSNPKDLEAVRSMLTNFVEKKRHDGELKGTGLRAETVLGKLPPAPAVTPTPAPPAPAPEAAAPAAEVPVVETPAPPPPAEAAGRTPASFAADIAAGKKLDSPEDAQFYQNNAAEIEAELKKIVTKPSSTTETSTKLLTRSSFRDPRDFWEYLKGLPIGALNGSEIEASGWMGEDLSGTVESEDSERLTVRKYDGTKALVDRVSINDVISKAPTTPPAPEPPSVEPTEPEAGGAGAPVAGGPTAVTPTEGAGAVESVRVVPPVADAEQPAGGEGAQPVAVTPAAEVPAPAPKEKVLKGTPEARVKALNINAAIGGVPDLKVIREILEPIDPKIFQAVSYWLGVDPQGNLLVGANNMPQTPSAQEAGQMAGLGDNSGDRVKKVAKALGIDAKIVRKFQASQNEAFAMGRSKTASESGTGARVEPKESGVLTDESWYEPIAKKGLKGANHTELARAVLLSQRYLGTTKENESVAMGLMNEAQARAKRPEFAAAFRKQQEILSPDRTGISRKGENEAALLAEPEYEEDVAPGQEEAVEEGEKAEIEDAQQTRTGPVDLQNSRDMEAALRGKSFMESIDYAIKNARDDLDKQILVKAKRRAEELANKGVVFTFSLTAPGRILTGGRLGLTTTVPAGLGDAVTVDVKLNGFTNDPSDTLSQETLVHEIIHAVTTAQIEYAPQGTAAIKLRVLQQELVGVYNSRFRAGTLTATEKGVVSNALEKPSELLAYGLTNGEVQNWLASIPSPTGGTFLSRMFDIVSQVLGLKGKENSALARLMSISEEILDESLAPYVTEANRRGMSLGKQANTTGFPGWVWKESQGLKPVWNQGPVALYEGTSTSGKTIYVAAKQNVGSTNVDIRSYTGRGFTPAELTDLRKAADGFTPQATPRIAPETEKAVEGVDVIGEQAPALTPKGNPALRMRIKFADSLAGLEDVFTAAYSGQVRTATGRLNPMVLLSRALDTQRVSRAVQKEGALVTKEGLLMADKLVVDGREISYKDTLARIAETAKKEDKTYEQYRETIDKVLYGHREYNLREYNRDLDQQADALEAAGKTKDAKAMREDKITLALNDKQIDALEDAFQKDAFIQGVSKDLDAIRFSLLDKLVEVGRISEEKVKEWKENTGYIPFHRIEQYNKEYDEAGRGTNRGVVAMKKIRSLEGSERATTSPVENFSQFMDWAVGEAMKNEAGTRALTDLELLGSAKRQEEKPSFDAPGGMVTVYEKGVPVKFYVQDPGLYVGLSLQEKELGSIAKAFQRLGTQPLRAGVTALPPFAIKQVFDDIVRAYAYAGVKNNAAVVKSILLNFPKNWYKEIFKVKDKGIQELENLGVVGTFDFTKQGNLKNILEEAGAKKEGLGSAIFRVMEAGAKASDLAVRQAIYQQVLKETGDTAQAESAAREIINFSRRGAAGAMQTAISVIPFFNAYAQGMDKLATAAAGRVVGTKLGVARSMFYKRMAVLTGMGVAYALLMSDDEDYQALPDHVRDTNWILPYGKYLGYTPAIPVPAELAFFFKAIPERVVQYYKHQGTDEERAALDVLKELLVRGVDVFSSPNLTPQLIRPFLENIANYSFFLGRPLESQAQLRQLPFMRAGTSTSDSMKWVAEKIQDAANATGIEAIAISPIKLENLIRGLLGTAGGTALALSDAAFFPSRTDRPLHQQLKSQLTGASAVMKDAVGTRYLDKVYKLESDVEQVYNTYNRLLQDKPEKTAEFIEDNKGLYSIRPAVQGLMTAIRSLNAAARQIDKTTDISSDERRRRIDELRVEQNDLARQALMLRKLAMDIQLGK